MFRERENHVQQISAPQLPDHQGFTSINHVTLKLQYTIKYQKIDFQAQNDIIALLALSKPTNTLNTRDFPFVIKLVLDK